MSYLNDCHCLILLGFQQKKRTLTLTKTVGGKDWSVLADPQDVPQDTGTTANSSEVQTGRSVCDHQPEQKSSAVRRSGMV